MKKWEKLMNLWIHKFKKLLKILILILMKNWNLIIEFENNKNKFKKLSNYHPVLRIGKPSEISELSLFLTSEKAGFINGTIFQIDGGISKCLHDPI